MLRSAIVAGALSLAAVGCQALTPTAAPSSAAIEQMGPINVDNETTMDVTVRINGAIATTAPAMSYVAVQQPLSTRPWQIDAEAPDGTLLERVLVGVDTQISDVAGVGTSGRLACGLLTVWAGGPRPDAPDAGETLPPCGYPAPTLEIPPPRY